MSVNQFNDGNAALFKHLKIKILHKKKQQHNPHRIPFQFANNVRAQIHRADSQEAKFLGTKDLREQNSRRAGSSWEPAHRKLQTFVSLQPIHTMIQSDSNISR